MSASDDLSVLRRMAGAARRQATSSVRTPAKVLSEVVAKACEQTLGLKLTTTSVSDSAGARDKVLEGLDPNGLHMMLADPDGAFGLLVMNPGALSATTEMVTTGRIADHAPPERAATRIDAAIVEDVLSRVLAGFETATSELPNAAWAGGYRLAEYLNKPSMAKLILERGSHRKLVAHFGFGTGERRAEWTLILPERRNSGSANPDRADVQAADWKRRMSQSVGGAEVPLKAILWRLRQPLSMLQGLQPGTVIPLPLSAIGGVTLVGLDGRSLAQGRLGQSNGRKAVRIQVAPLPKAEPQIAPLKPPQPPPAEKAAEE